MARTKKLYQNDTLSQIGTVSQNGKRSRLVSLNKRLTSMPSLAELMIEINSATRHHQIKHVELSVLIYVSDQPGLTLTDVESLKLHHPAILVRTFQYLIDKEYIHRDEELRYHLKTAGYNKLKAILPSFTFPLPRY